MFKKLQSLSIERQLRLMAVISATVALLLACAALSSYDFLSFRRALANRMIAFADIVGYNSASALVFNDPASAERTLSALRARGSVVEAALFSAKGEVFAKWMRAQDPRPPLPPLRGAPAERIRLSTREVEVFHPVVLDGTFVGTVYIRSDLSEQYRRLRRNLAISLLVLLVALLLAAIAAHPIGRQISRPLLDLVEVARRVTARRDYSVRASGPGSGEVGLLVATFNDMLSQIEQRGAALQKAHDELERKVVERTKELQEKEAELSQSRRLESVGRLAAGVAHDFNNLLTGIIGCSESLEEALPLEDPNRLDVLEIKKAGQRAAGLTRQLLAFGRRQIISPRRLDLNAVVRQTMALLRRLIGEDIEVTFLHRPDLWPIHADPGQIDQILMNLAVNARDAMPSGGKLTIKTDNVPLGEDTAALDLDPGDYVMLTVSDTGLGMTRDVQSHIFEPFFTTKERGKGTGLGLATVYGIVHQNAGAVSVYSQPGLGATFKIFIPRFQDGHNGEAQALPPVAAPRKTPGGEETLLLVEDEELVASHVSRLLRRLGYTVLVAPNGREALALMQARGAPVDLVLTDVIMPEMNGRELMRELDALYPGLRALYMSGYPAEVVAQQGILDSGISFIEKPFYGDQIARKLREVLDGSVA